MSQDKYDLFDEDDNEPGRIERRVDGLQGLFKVLLVLWDAGVPFLPPDPRPDQLLELLGGNSIEIF